MLARLPAAFLLAFTACAAHEGPTPDRTPDLPAPPRAEIQVAIASVQLAQNCPDPPGEAAPTADQPYTPPPPAQPAPQAGPSPKRMAGAATAQEFGGGWSPPCVQSTMQLSLANSGDRPGTIEIKAIRLFDGETRRELGPLVGRKPFLWSPDGSYRPWNEQAPARATTKAAYRISEPDWGRVQSTLGATVNLYSRLFFLELEVVVDGRSQIVRSPEVVRDQIYQVVT